MTKSAQKTTTLYIADNFILFTLTSPVGRLIASVIADGPKLDYYLPSLILRTILYHVGSPKCRIVIGRCSLFRVPMRGVSCREAHSSSSKPCNAVSGGKVVVTVCMYVVCMYVHMYIHTAEMEKLRE